MTYNKLFSKVKTIHELISLHTNNLKLKKTQTNSGQLKFS